jgi:hypothetical protein
VRVGSEGPWRVAEVLPVHGGRVAEAGPFGVEGREVAFGAADLGPKDARVGLPSGVLLERAQLGRGPAERRPRGVDRLVELLDPRVQGAHPLPQVRAAAASLGGSLCSPAHPTGSAHEARTAPPRS